MHRPRTQERIHGQKEIVNRGLLELYRRFSRMKVVDRTKVNKTERGCHLIAMEIPKIVEFFFPFLNVTRSPFSVGGGGFW